MRVNWISTTIGDQITLQRGIDITKASQRPGRVPVVSSGGISSYHDTAFSKGPGVVLGRKGVVGSVYYIAADYWPHDTSLWVRDFHGNDPRFVYYFFKRMAPELASMDVGSANPTLNRNHVHPKPITWPPLPEQRAIAHILGTLDDKIELIWQMNQTLDEIARTLFRSWFVDFDPVRAKAEGRQPEGMDAETAALFPDLFVDSKLGPIPEGWKISTVSEIASLSKQIVKPGTFLDEQFHHYSLPAFDKGETPILEFGGQIASNKTLILPDSVLISKLNPHIPRIWLPDVQSGTRSIGSTEFLALVPKERNVRSFLYCLLKSRSFQLRFQSRVSGTTGSHQRVTPDGLLSIMYAIPDRRLMLAFDLLVGQMLRYRQTNIGESETLAALRDTLLPELLSGRISMHFEDAVAGMDASA